MGGKTDGELDGIQAWKKDMKAREKKEKGAETSTEPVQKTDAPSESQTKSDAAPADPPLDEIQMFKLMMKKEAAKKETEHAEPEGSTPTSGGPSSLAKDDSARKSVQFSLGCSTLMYG